MCDYLGDYIIGKWEDERWTEHALWLDADEHMVYGVLKQCGIDEPKNFYCLIKLDGGERTTLALVFDGKLFVG